VPSFDKLAHMNDTTFYADDRGIHYAAARYLLYYLQEKGMLRSFYTTARGVRKQDPSAYQSLVKTLGERDMAAFQKRWTKYVAGLRFDD